jgi:uncharacterized protein YbaP (TraB family)
MKSPLTFFRTVVPALFLSVAVANSAPAIAPTPEKATAKGILYEVKAATNTVYLFGSIHVGKADFYPLSEAVEAAYRQADVLAVEWDVSDKAAMMKLPPLSMYSPPDRLENHVTAATWQKLKSSMGPAAETFRLVKPAFLSMTLMMREYMRQGYDPKMAVDLHFIERASIDKKKIVELEGFELQVGILGGLSDEDGNAMLDQTLDGWRSGEALREIANLVSAWKSGDAARLETLIHDATNKDAGSKKVWKVLLDDRNVGMTQKIATALEHGDRQFVVVGAGHLVGENSVTNLLKKQGLQVRQIK